MAFKFGKDKKSQAPATLSRQDTDERTDTKGTQDSIANSREVRKDIERRFRELNDPMSRETMRKAAQKNQAALDEHEKACSYISDDNDETYSDYTRLEKDMYIVTGGYRNSPDEDSTVPKTNLDSYIKAIAVLENKYRSTSSANAVETGADRLEVYVEGFLGNLRNALERGYAMKANAAIDLIRYVFVIGHRFEDYSSEAERSSAVDRKVKFLETVGKDTIDTIDALYDAMAKYAFHEGKYEKSLEKLVGLREEYERSCPAEVKQLINSLGYKGAMSQLPVGDSRRTYLNMMLNIQSALTNVLMGSLMLESEMRDIIVLKNGIENLTCEIGRAFVTSGKVYDFNKHVKVINEINERNLKEMRDVSKRATENANMEQELMSRLDEIANNVALGKAVQYTDIALRDYNFLQKQNKVFNDAQDRARMEYESEKRKALLEEEERKLQLREKAINDELEFEEALRHINEQLNSNETPDNTEDELVLNNSTEDNREIIEEI